MIEIEQESALKAVQLLKPVHGSIVVFHMHRTPVIEDSDEIMRIIRKVPAQILVILLGPGDSVEQIVAQQDDATLAAYGLQRIPKVAP